MMDNAGTTAARAIFQDSPEHSDISAVRWEGDRMKYRQVYFLILMLNLEQITQLFHQILLITLFT